MEDDEELGERSFDGVGHRHHRRLRHLRHGEGGVFDLLGPQPVAGDGDHIVDAAQDADVPVGRLDGAVAAHVGPVPPVPAGRVSVEAGVVGLDVPVRVAPDGLHLARPGVPDAKVPCLA